MDKSAIDTPSREIDLRNIPVHLRTALRRALEFEARAPAPRSAEEAEQCEEQLRGHRGRVLRRPPHPRAATRGVLRRGWRRGERPRAPPAPADAERRPGDRQRSHLPGHDGAGHDAVLPRETRPSGEAEAGTLPRLGGAGHLRPVHAEAGLGCKPRGRHAQLAGRSAAQLRSDDPLDIKTLRSTAYRYGAGPSAACWTDREAGGRRTRRKKRGPKTKKGRNRFHTDWKEPILILYVVGDDARSVSDVGPDLDGTGDRRRSSPCCCRTRGRSAPLTRSPTARPGSGNASSASRRARALADTDRPAASNSRRGQAAPLERVAQPHAGASRGAHGPAGAVPRAHGRQDPHAPQLLPEEPSSFPLHHNERCRRKRHPSRHQSPHQGASIYWLPESVDAILLLRSFYKSGRWNCLQRMAMTPVGVSA